MNGNGSNDAPRRDVEDDPRAHETRGTGDEPPASAERRDSIGDAFPQRQLRRDQFVRVLNPIFQERVGPADSLRERREHVERRVRLAPEEIEKFVPLQDERFDVAQSVRRRRPVPSVEEPELAEQLARLQHVDDELFSHFVDDGELDAPASQHVAHSAAIPLVEDPPAGVEMHFVGERGDGRAFFVVHRLEKRDVAEDVRARRHLSGF